MAEIGGSYLGGFLIGWAFRRFLKMAAMIVAVALMTALTPLSPVLWVVALVLFITGAVQGVLNIGGNALLVWVYGSKVGPLMNGLHFCFGVGTFIAPVIVGQLVARPDGLRWIYLLLAVIILPTAAVALIPSPPPPQAPRPAAGSQQPAQDVRLIVLISLVFGCYSGASLAYGGWVSTYAIRMNLGDATQAAFLTSIYWGALTLGRLAAIPLALRFSPKAILRADFAGAVLSLLALLFFPRSLAALIVTSAGLGFALASIYPTTMSLSGQLMVISGRVTGLFSIGNSLGAMLIPWLIGQFFDSAGPQSLSLVLIVDMILALGVLVGLDRAVKRPVAAVEEG